MTWVVFNRKIRWKVLGSKKNVTTRKLLVKEVSIFVPKVCLY